jgi:hypothetical protein
MSHHRSHQLGVAIALAAALGLAAAQPGAAQSSGRQESRLLLPQPGLFERAWDWLAREVGSLPGGPSLHRLWAKEGGGIDPNGARYTGAMAPRCTACATMDAGPGLDPNGGH